jgi:hypothetical protein
VAEFSGEGDADYVLTAEPDTSPGLRTIDI